VTGLAFGLILPLATSWLWLSRSPARALGMLVRVVLAIAAGIGLSSALWWILLQLPVQSLRTLSLLDGALWCVGLMSAGAWCLRRQADGMPTVVPPAGRTSRWAIGLVSLATGLLVVMALVDFVAATAVTPHGSWDAWAIWNARARFLFHAFPAWREAFLPPAAHPDYPLQLPLSVVRLWSYMGRDAVAAPITIAAAFTAILPLGVGGAVGRRAGLVRSLVACMFVLANPILLEWAPAQQADVPLSAFILLTLVIAVEADHRGDCALWAMAGCAASLAAWTKNEGLLFALILLGVSAVVTSRRRAAREWLACLCGAAPILLVLVAFKLSVPIPNDILGALSVARVQDTFGDWARISTVVAAMGRAMWFDGGDVIGVLPLLAAYIGLAGRVRRDVSAWWPLVVLACLLVGYAGAYVVTPQNLNWHLQTSLPRLVLHVTPALVWAGMRLLEDPPVLAISGSPPGYSSERRTRTALK